MSFLSVLKKIGGGLLVVAETAAPIVSVFNPGVGEIIRRITGAVVKAEDAFPNSGSGTDKLQAAIGDFDAGLAITQEVLSMRGENLSYDENALKDANSSLVSFYNAVAKLKGSFRIEKV